MTTQSSPLRVLVVDDEPLICWSLAETLSDLGDVVIETGTGAEAMRALRANEPVDVVLLDYRLPDVQNLSLLSTIRRRWPDSRVILLSAYMTPEIATEALARGASRAISKPVDMSDVFPLVHDVARRQN
jgi:two-component system nitrogen regulation response regulator GlnG